MIDVVALGELLIDFAAKSTDAAGYPTMAANPGGAPGNFLAALNAYGRKTAFLGKVGDDTFGHLLLGTLSRAGIETKGILVDDHFFTTLAFVTFDETGDRSFAVARKPGADTQIRLTPGESIFVTQYLYHDFEVEPGTGAVLLGEVSQCNDDAHDNRFNPPMGRFPAIEEDEPPYRLLCTEYPNAKD